MSSCPAPEQLSLYFDKEDMKPDTVIHIEQCPDCQKQLAVFSRLETLVSSELAPAKKQGRVLRPNLYHLAPLALLFVLFWNLYPRPEQEKSLTQQVRVVADKSYTISTNEDTILLSVEINGHYQVFEDE